MDRNYWAFIPADVRYDDRLSPNAKLFYAEITALTNQEGYCWASNEFFANIYKVSPKTISRWISELKKAEHITVEYQYNDKKVSGRFITVKGVDKNVHRGRQKCLGGVDKNVPVLYTSSTTKNKEEYKAPENLKKAYKHILPLFPERYRPKTKAQHIKWIKELDRLDKSYGYSPRHVYVILQKAMADQFWAKNIRSLIKLTQFNKEGVRYIDIYAETFTPDIDSYEFRSKD
jgi:hypothetical protein